MKNSIILITLSCFIGQLLVGCNVGNQGSATSMNSFDKQATLTQKQLQEMKAHGIDINKLGNTSFEDANKDKRLWGPNIARDANKLDSRLNYQVNNKSMGIFGLVGCMGTPNGVEVNLPKVFPAPQMKVTSDELVAKGYPDFMLDPKSFESGNYIRFNELPSDTNTSFTCFYKIEIPNEGAMYFNQKVSIFKATTIQEFNQYLDGIVTSQKTDPVLTKPRLIAWLAPSVASILSSFASSFYQKKFGWKSVDKLNNIVMKARRDNFGKLVKLVRDGKAGDAVAFAKKNNLTQFLNENQDAITFKGIFKKDVQLEEIDYKVTDLRVNEEDGSIECYLKSVDGSKASWKRATTVDESFGNQRFNVITDKEYKEYFKSKSSKEVAKTVLNQKEVAQDLQFELAEKETIVDDALTPEFDLAVDASAWRFAAFTGAFSLVVFTLIESGLMHLFNKAQGAYTTTLVRTQYGQITQEQESLYNAGKLPQDRIYANTIISNQLQAAHEQSFTLSFAPNSGYDAQTSIQFIAAITSNPQSRAYGSDGGKSNDPYLGDSKDNQDDAVIMLNLGSSSVAQDTNTLDDDRNEILNLAGMANLGTPLLPNPEYKLLEIKNTKTGKSLYSQGNSNSLIKASANNIEFGTIKGLALNSDQEARLDVSIPKDGAFQKFGNAVDDLIASGFRVKFVSESSEGASELDTIQSVSEEKLLKDNLTDPKTSEFNYPYFYGVYTCSYPTKIGDSCGLQMHVGGMDNDKHIGKVYIADGASRATAIPVYLNYHLLGSYFELNVSDKTSPYKIDIMNTHNEAYTKMTLEYKSVDDDSYKSVPMDMLAKDTTCNLDSGLQPQAQCSIYFDFSKIDSDSYQFRINGIKATAKLGAPDQFDVKVRVN